MVKIGNFLRVCDKHSLSPLPGLRELKGADVYVDLMS